ncbi:MAG: anti-sigma factor [Blastocatellia bacterium]|nr:anti-sigma factor [Blastocatellia bacterium]
MNNVDEVRMLDLLIQQATYGLSDEEARELAQLESASPSGADNSIELTAAAVSMVGIDQSAEMPSHLRAIITADAARYFDEQDDARRAATPVVSGGDTANTGSFWNSLGWLVAAAACIALAVNLYTTRQGSEIAAVPTPTPEVERVLTPAEQRQQLLASAPDVTTAAVAKGNVPEIEDVTGDIVWSDQAQAGYVRVRGLPANDPTREIYQLWIFEESQGDKTPIDGGIFDINEEGEAIIPIDARLKTQNPGLFAITIERPGGVVVSDRKRIAALAKNET